MIDNFISFLNCTHQSSLPIHLCLLLVFHFLISFCWKNWMELLLSRLESHVAGSWELKSDLDRLRNSLPRVNDLMDKAEWWRFKNAYISHLLKQLRHAAYDTEDLITIFDYYELKKKIEGQASSSSYKKLIPASNSYILNLLINIWIVYELSQAHTVFTI